MNNPALDAGLASAFDNFDVDEDIVSGSDDRTFTPAGKCRQSMPAWKRIEEYREMRELNRHLMDDVYGSSPVQSLWDGD